MIDKPRLEAKCSTWNITLTGTQLDQLDAFAEILVDYNQKVMGGCTFGGRALPPGLFGASSETGPFAWELLRSPSASPERSLPKQNYFLFPK